ncbi:MAG: MarR family winged helix-turn-helix transcriptional regulator [Eubacteriales bacterium]|nr:MarR family winged helix-turn-helix transcriptional regulator [Eubacteriales bacterium]
MNADLLTNPMLLKRLYDEQLRPVTQRCGLTRVELDILLFLANNPSYDTARDIVHVRMLSKSQVSASLDALAARGMLRAYHSADNRKVAHLTLLPPSADAVEQGRRAQQRFQEVLRQGIAPEELRRVERTVAQMTENIRAYLGEGERK